MAEHVRESDFCDLDYEEKYNAYMEWLDEQEAKAEPASYSKVIVFLCILTTIAFTVTCFVFLWHGKSIDSTLTLCFFGCYGIEFASLAAIKCSKNKHLKGDAAAKQMPKVEIEEEEDGEVSK